MFGLFKKKPAPEGPVEIGLSILVERPPSDVYPLIDWADERNAKRQLGNEVSALDGSPNAFRLIMTEMPEHNFDMLVSEATPHSSYRYTTDINPRVGRLEASEEHYRIEPADDGQCELSLSISATFRPGLNIDEFKQEVVMVSVACRNALLKLKAHAEGGVEAVHALDAQLYG